MNQSNQLAIQVDQGQVDQALQWLMRLPQLPPEDRPALHDVEATVAALSEPCRPAWCMARVAALLNPYYDKETPQVVREMEAEDWMESLAAYPQWAVDRAVRWWKSEANADRRKRPLEGDIAARCKVEMRGIGSVPYLVSRAIAPRQDPPRPEIDDTERARRAAVGDELIRKLATKGE